MITTESYSISVIRAEENAVVAEGKVSESSSVFEDHFPGFPVVPGVLMLDLILKVGRKALGWQRPWAFENVRYSGFLKPAMNWTLVLNARKENVWQAVLESEGSKILRARLSAAQS